MRRTDLNHTRHSGQGDTTLMLKHLLGGDAMACELPADHDLWPRLALSCFVHEGRPVPILDTERLFAANLNGKK